MKNIHLNEFNKDTRRFENLKQIQLSSVPTIGDKITIDIDGIGYVFKVYDVLYSDDALTDVNIIRLSTITEYYSSKFPDIIIG